MQILGNIFNAVIFVSAIGSIFTVISLFVNHVLRCNLPLWFSLCGMIFLSFHFCRRMYFLIRRKYRTGINGFRIASFLWACGCSVLIVHDVIRLMLAKRAIRRYQICNNERLNSIYTKCAAATTLKNVPTLYCGTLDNPICVTGVICPVIIMNERIIEQLTDNELSAVFFHELTHVKRKTMPYWKDSMIMFVL